MSSSRRPAGSGDLTRTETAVGAFSAFGLYVEARHSLTVLATAFHDCALSPMGIAHRINSLDELQQGGAFLYSGLFLMSAVGLVAMLQILTEKMLQHYNMNADIGRGVVRFGTILGCVAGGILAGALGVYLATVLATAAPNKPKTQPNLESCYNMPCRLL